jgi:hypothetical protein
MLVLFSDPSLAQTFLGYLRRAGCIASFGSGAELLA